MKKVSFYTLGCKVNQYETNAIAQQLKQNGYALADEGENPDITVVNSCTVTSTADKKSRQAVRHFKREGQVVVLTGCVPQAYPEQALELTEADIVLGNRNNGELADALNEYFETGKRVCRVARHSKDEPFACTSVAFFEGRTRAVVKIQDGCDRFCSYCVIPIARGRVRSKPMDALKEELAALARSGFKEVVFAGINLSSFGRDTGHTLADAVKLACEQPGIARVRLGSLEPDHLTDSMLDALSECGKLCPQFHISLQSGCDNTLRRMNRHYTSEQYMNLCEKLRLRFDGSTLTTDVMTGFPGETEDDFSECLRFVEKVGFEKLHVFPYSVREGTRAAKMDGQLDKSVKESRCKTMIALGEQLRQSFFDRQLGKTVNVLLETKSSDGFLSGYTENYTPVKIKAPQELCGEICQCVITGKDGDYCVGEFI